MAALAPSDLEALAVTVRLAATVTALLFVPGLPLGWWLARTRSRWRGPVGALVALPLVLPPTVLGFYLLLALGPDGPLARLGLGGLPFTFGGLVVASMLYSLPFVVQPLQRGFEAIPARQLDVAASLGAGPLDRLVSVALPQAWPAVLGAAVLGFAHTVGEFGVVLMIGGNIPGRTRVASLALYDHVESGDYAQAHVLALCLLLASFAALLGMAWLQRRRDG